MLLPVQLVLLLLVMMSLTQAVKRQQVLRDRKRVKMGLKKYLAENVRRQKGDLTGELLDKMINMQEKSDKMLMELELKRTRLEEKQMEMDMQIQREEREYQLQVLNLLSQSSHSLLPPSAPSFSMYGYGGYDPDATQDGL